MAGGVRFGLYRFLMGLVQAQDFKLQVVLPLELPGNERIQIEPLAPEFPRLFRATNFPASEHAEKRYKRVVRSKPLLGLIGRIGPRRTAPIPADIEGFLAAVYPARYRKLWPKPPAVPAGLGEALDRLASLALRGPFACYLRRADAPAGAAGDPTGGVAGPNDYVIDMSLFDGYPTKPGLMKPGGVAVFGLEAGRLCTRGIVRDGALVTPDAPAYALTERAFLCALNTHLTTLAHNAVVHLSLVTPVALATTNELPPDHPVRRLLHWGFQTVLVGNWELATFQIIGPGSFAAEIFSHEYGTVVELINRHIERFRIADLDPEQDVARRGMGDTPFEQPGRDNLLTFWAITKDFVHRYLALYYKDDAAVAGDEALTRWRSVLDTLLPGGLADDTSWVGNGPLTLAELERICSAYIHTSTVTHDQLNNVVWNYSTLNFWIPLQVPASGEQQDQRVSFDFISTLIGTWKPFNMLTDGISLLALDEQARALMNGYVDDLRKVDVALAEKGLDREPDFTYARNLNFSVTN
jgi:arachidonate 15-lipoxygenase